MVSQTNRGLSPDIVTLTEVQRLALAGLDEEQLRLPRQTWTAACEEHGRDHIDVDGGAVYAVQLASGAVREDTADEAVVAAVVGVGCEMPCHGQHLDPGEVRADGDRKMELLEDVDQSGCDERIVRRFSVIINVTRYIILSLFCS